MDPNGRWEIHTNTHRVSPSKYPDTFQDSRARPAPRRAPVAQYPDTLIIHREACVEYDRTQYNMQHISSTYLLHTLRKSIRILSEYYPDSVDISGYYPDTIRTVTDTCNRPRQWTQQQQLCPNKKQLCPHTKPKVYMQAALQLHCSRNPPITQHLLPPGPLRVPPAWHLHLPLPAVPLPD